jgi:hypothetical protein
MVADKQMNHAAYQRKCRTMDVAALMFTIKDAQEAIAANPSNPNNGYYADEVCYCSMELRRRQQV